MERLSHCSTGFITSVRWIKLGIFFSFFGWIRADVLGCTGTQYSGNSIIRYWWALDSLMERGGFGRFRKR